MIPLNFGAVHKRSRAAEVCGSDLGPVLSKGVQSDLSVFMLVEAARTEAMPIIK